MKNSFRDNLATLSGGHLRHLISSSGMAGKVVRSLEISKDASFLRFKCDDGHVEVWEAEGDCCSHSWFHEIHNPSALLGHTIESAEWLDLDSLDSPDGEEKWYGFNLNTTGGATKIVFRNSSNGYYGGSVEVRIGDVPDSLDNPFAAITEDFEWGEAS